MNRGTNAKEQEASLTLVKGNERPTGAPFGLDFGGLQANVPRRNTAPTRLRIEGFEQVYQLLVTLKQDHESEQ